MVDYAFENVRNESVTVGTTQTKIAVSRTQNAQQDRQLIVVRNISPNAADIITVNFGVQTATTANTGIVLRQYESFTDASGEGYKAYQGQINAICATANGLLAIFER